MTDNQPASDAHRLLVVDGDKDSRRLLVTILTAEGYACQSTSDTSRAQSLLTRNVFDLLLYGAPLPDKSGLDWFRNLNSIYPKMGTVIVTAIGSLEMARRVLSLNSYGYIVKPVNTHQAIIAVAHALRRRDLELTVNHFGEMIVALKADRQEKEKAYHDLDNALNVLLKKREQDKAVMGDQILNNIRKIITPNVERLQKFRLSPRHQRMLGLIQMNLEEIASPFVKTLSSAYLDLTPNEIQVADLIKQGKRTKEIAAIMNLSVNTIMTHRYRIRTKLGLKNKKTHLGTFLNTLKFQ